MDAWVVITIAAAFLQNVRSTLQKYLKGHIGTTGATFVRFGYGLPFAFLFLGILYYVMGYTLPRLHWVFAGWVVLAALAQIFAQALLIHLFSYRNFAVGTAYSRTEPAQAALFGLIFLSETVSWVALLAIAISVAGVMLISVARTELKPSALVSSLATRSVAIGLCSGMFFGIAIPSTLGTDGTRALYLGRTPPGATRALSTVVGDRVIGLVTLMTVAALALLFGPRGDLPPFLAIALGLLSAASLIGWILAPALANQLPEGNRLRELIRGDLLPLFRHPKLLAKAFSLSLLVHLLHIAGQKCLTDALGIEVSWGFIAIYHPLIVLATAIPITIGGFGLREATYALLLPFAGIPTDDAIVLSLLWWTVGALGGLIGGALYAVSGGAPQDLERKRSLL